MLDSKFFLKSKTVWGVLVAFAPALLAAVGIDIEADVGQLDGAVKMLLDAFNQLNEAIGGLLIVFGMRNAETSLSLLPKKG